MRVEHETRELGGGQDTKWSFTSLGSEEPSSLRDAQCLAMQLPQLRLDQQVL
jgi:hypothetical protein